MRQEAVQFLAGTDLVNAYIFPGFSLHDELGLLVKAGLSNLEALQASTWNAALFME
jgi:imidazolonepropionase-like amidohydrolase